MTYGLARVTSGAITEPVSLDDAKLHLRVDLGDDDDLIEQMITSARQSCEASMQRSLVPQSWLLTLSGFFPLHSQRSAWGGETTHECFARQARHGSDTIVLPNPPVRSVTSVTYLDRTGNRVPLDPSRYRLALVGEKLAVLRPVGGSWPATAMEPDAVVIQYEAGWDDATQIPAAAISWIKLRIGALYENREAFAAGAAIPALGFADGLLDPHSKPVA